MDTPRYHSGDKLPGLIVQAVRRAGDTLHYEVWDTAKSTIVTLTREQLQARLQASHPASLQT